MSSQSELERERFVAEMALAIWLDSAHSDAIQSTLSDDPQKAIQVGAHGIQQIDEFERDYPPKALGESNYDYFRAAFHGAQAWGYWQLGAKTKNRDLLTQAKAEANAALGYPSKVYESVPEDIRPWLRMIRDGIDAESKSGGCFIATAAYGSADASDVLLLRRFRDQHLRSHRLGRWFIHLYEHTSPPLARWIAQRAWARFLVRRLIVRPLAHLASGILESR